MGGDYTPVDTGPTESALQKGINYVDQTTGKVMDSIGVPDATVGGVASTIMGGIKGFINKLEMAANLSRQGENRENVQSLLSAFGLDSELGSMVGSASEALDSQETVQATTTPITTPDTPKVLSEIDPNFVGPKLMDSNSFNFVGPIKPDTETPITTPNTPVQVTSNLNTNMENSLSQVHYNGQIEDRPSQPISTPSKVSFRSKIEAGLDVSNGSMYYNGKYYKRHANNIIYSQDMKNWDVLPEEELQWHSISTIPNSPITSTNDSKVISKTSNYARLEKMANDYTKYTNETQPLYDEILNRPSVKNGIIRNNAILSGFSNSLGLDFNKLFTNPIEIKRPTVSYDQVRSVSGNYDDMVSRAELEVEKEPTKAKGNLGHTATTEGKPPIIINQHSTSNGIVNSPDTTNKIIKFDPEVDDLVSQLFAATSNAFKKEIYLFGTGISI
jgi:hypothetical protein